MAPLDSGGLFPPTGLLNDIGLIKPRWAQDGSDVINIFGNGVDDEVIYTVTTGKRLFITSAVLDTAAVGNVSAQLKDSAVGDSKIEFNLTDPQTSYANFDTPLFFDTSVYIQSTNAADITLTGWEEDAP
jgi:hypothetical protein